MLAVAAIASCAKTEDVYTGEDAEIKIKPAAAIATKANVTAAIDGTEYPVAENFDVYAYWKAEPAGSKFTEGATKYLGIDGPAVEFTNKGNFWGGKDETYYWPKNGSLRFAAYSPSSVDMTHDLATDTYSVDGYVQPNLTDDTWDLLVAPTSASYTSMTAAENVSVVFEHALSWITVKVVAKDAAAAQAFDIKKVTINDVVTTADLDAVMTEAKTEDKMKWTLSTTKDKYVVFEGSQFVTLNPADIETTTNGTIVIPQPTTSITVDYTQRPLPGTPQLDNQSVTMDLILDGEDTPWKAGKHYVYTLVFGLDEILINPDVVDWDDVVVETIDVDNAKVSTAKQLADAVKHDGTITLQEDIVLTESLTVAKNVALDLNGHSITYEGNAAAHSEMIKVTNSLIVRDSQGGGSIVYNYTGVGDPNFGWGSYTINNLGTFVLESGKIEIVSDLNTTTHANHMYCAIQAGYGAKSTTIYGGEVVNNTYRSIRVNQGSLTVAAGDFVGQVWMQPSSDNTSITIKDGNFQPMGVDGSSVYVENGSKVVAMNVSGGNFKTKLGVANTSKDGAKGSVTGGVYGTKPADDLVADGYIAATKEGKYVVVKGNVTAFVATQDEFEAAIADNAVVVLSAGNYVVPTAAHGKTVTFIGTENPADVQVSVVKVGIGGENCDYGLDGSTVTFENITITTNSSTYIGYARCKATFKNCIFNGTYTLYDVNKFENCTFNVSGDVYNVWTWGAPTAQFDKCVFNSDGKALLLYGQANTKLTVNDCVFNDNGGLADLKAAIEIGNDYNSSYELIVNNTVVNGYEINDKGINTGTTLWANKNSMSKEKLNVVVNGVDVY